jgi:energy-coupling factor transporter ATP-binding protein EcfA2
MYLHRFEIQNIRSIEWVHWEVAREQAAGWHVIIGDNGSGKSSLLRALALTLVGPSDAMALRQDWGSWVRDWWPADLVAAFARDRPQHGAEVDYARTRIQVDRDKEYDKFSKGGRTVERSLLEIGLSFKRVEGGHVELKKRPRLPFDPARHVWGTGDGWFSASYGPFRRFFGGDKDLEKLNYTHPKLARHLSVFGEGVALTECITWLKDLHYKQLDHKPEGDLLTPLREFINQDGFLPHKTRLKSISPDGVLFEDGNGYPVLVENLSDGYRSILSMTFELIRQLALAYGSRRVFDPNDPSRVIAPGVVLIDEIDAHLHPTWQRRVGLWFRKHFPNLQFVVTTHSPLVCQAADHGTVYRLPRPGTNEEGTMVAGKDLYRLLYGNVLDAYDTELFGEDVGRSDAGREKMGRLAELNTKELTTKLTAAEKREQARLREQLSAVADASEDDE